MRILRLLPIAAAATALACFPSELPAQEDVRQKEAVLLVAHPAMTDLRFAETVVLVTFPPDAGPMGVVLNKPSLVELRNIWPQNPGRQGRTDVVHYGGPVEPDGLLFVFRMTPAPKRAVWVTDDIYFSGDGKLLEQLLHEPKPVPHQRFFAGYAGWAPGQLEDEIDWGGWYVLPVDEEVIFDMPVEDMWERLLERATLPRASRTKPDTPATEDTESTEKSGIGLTQAPRHQGPQRTPIALHLACADSSRAV